MLSKPVRVEDDIVVAPDYTIGGNKSSNNHPSIWTDDVYLLPAYMENGNLTKGAVVSLLTLRPSRRGEYRDEVMLGAFNVRRGENTTRVFSGEFIGPEAGLFLAQSLIDTYKLHPKVDVKLSRAEAIEVVKHLVEKHGLTVTTKLKSVTVAEVK